MGERRCRPRDLPWMLDALCHEYPANWWFVEQGESGRKAKKVCRRCLVREDCLAYAIEHGEKYGIWGGFAYHETAKWRRARSCMLCKGRLAPAEKAALILAGVEPARWCCSECRNWLVRKVEEQRWAS